MLKHFLTTLIFIYYSATVFSQGSETFTNIPTSSGTYTLNNWTGDKGFIHEVVFEIIIIVPIAIFAS